MTTAPTASSGAASKSHFDRQYQTQLKHLKRKGLQPKTIDAYSRAIRRIGLRFDHQIDSLTEAQLTDYFSELIASHPWSAVKLDLYGLKFYTMHVLRKPWVAPGLIKLPRVQRLPDIVTVEDARRLFAATRVVSYRVFFFTLYSLGLRLGEGLRLQLADIDAAHARVHIRDAKGNKDRFVPLPQTTLALLRRRTEDPAQGGRDLRLKRKITPHSWRHSYATHLTLAGVDLIEVQKYLGHHSILTTVRYTHLTDQTKHHAILRINGLMDGFAFTWGKIK